MNSTIKKLGAIYLQLQDFACGKHPHLFPWHFQYLATKDIYRDLKRMLPELKGKLLDVGCGTKPYQAWANQADEYVGMDVTAGPAVDYVVEPGKVWPFSEKSFDSVLCTQVLEHVKDANNLLSELHRVLRPEGLALLSFPFIFNAHGLPHDYRRLTIQGARSLLEEVGGFEIIEQKPQGGIGSTLGLLFLNWIDTQSTRAVFTACLKGVLFPLWWGFCGLINVLGVIFDSIDSTKSFYSNQILLVRRLP